MRLKGLALGLAVVAICAVPAAGAQAGKKPPKVGTQVSLGANPSPLQDFVNFSGGLASKQRGCVTRRVEIRHGGNGALITRVSPEAPLRSGKLFSAFYDTKFFALNGDFVNGEKVRASVDQTKLKKGGRVIASCKAASKTATVLLSEG